MPRTPEDVARERRESQRLKSQGAASPNPARAPHPWVGAGSRETVAPSPVIPTTRAADLPKPTTPAKKTSYGQEDL